MKIYIYSQNQTILFAEGEHFKLNAKQPYALQLDSNFVEFDFGSGYETARVLFENNNCSDQKNAEIYELYSLPLIVPKLKKNRNAVYKNIFEEELPPSKGNIKTKIWSDGGIFLSFDFYGKNKIIELPFEPTFIKQTIIEQRYLLIEIKKEKTILVVFSSEGELLFFQQCDTFIIEKNLQTIKHNQGILGATVIDTWDLNNNFSALSRKVEPKNLILKEHLIYAFLEEIKLSYGYKKRLSDNLLQKADLIPDFIGNFKYVIPPINSAFPETVALVDKEVKYLKATISNTDNPKITDLTIENYPI